MKKKPNLTIAKLQNEAASFAQRETSHDEVSLYGVTDGKAIGTYFEHKFIGYLSGKYEFKPGSSASGMDFPGLGVDMKVTSTKQPQSSCPFKSAEEKIYGLDYHLLIFVYKKSDNNKNRTGRLDIKNIVFVKKERTADFQTTKGLLDILKEKGNEDDLAAFIMDRNLPVDEIGAGHLASKILKKPPKQGYLTISNALQWRLQYRRVIGEAGSISGILKVR